MFCFLNAAKIPEWSYTSSLLALTVWFEYDFSCLLFKYVYFHLCMYIKYSAMQYKRLRANTWHRGQIPGQILQTPGNIVYVWYNTGNTVTFQVIIMCVKVTTWLRVERSQIDLTCVKLSLPSCVIFGREVHQVVLNVEQGWALKFFGRPNITSIMNVTWCCYKTP